MRYLLLFSEATGAIVGHSIAPDEFLPEAPDGYAYLEASVADWGLAQSVNPQTLGLTLADSPQRVDPAARPMAASDILQEHGIYRANRREAYDPIGDQLDRVTAALDLLHQSGVDIGDAGREQVQRWRAVKDRFPKSGL